MFENLMCLAFFLISIITFEKLKILASFKKSYKIFLQIKDNFTKLNEKRVKLLFEYSKELVVNSFKQILFFLIIFLFYSLLNLFNPEFSVLITSFYGFIKLIVLSLIYVILKRRYGWL